MAGRDLVPMSDDDFDEADRPVVRANPVRAIGRSSFDTLSLTDALSRRWVNLRDCAAILGVTYQTLYSYRKKGLIKAVKVGGQFRIYEEELARFVTQGNLPQED